MTRASSKDIEIGTNNKSTECNLSISIYVEHWSLPKAAAATGTGAEVENINERPLDCINSFHFLL